MGKDELREKLMFKNFKWTAAKYYDYPDGQDLLGKLSFTTKCGFFFGAIGGFVYAARISPGSTSFRTIMLKTMLYTVPCVAAPFAFTTVTYFSTNFRQKDDQLNYVFGSIAAGITGAKLAGVPGYSLFLSLVFCTIGIAKKTAQMHGTLLFPPVIRRQEPPYYQRTLNLSLLPEGQPQWTDKPLAAEE